MIYIGIDPGPTTSGVVTYDPASSSVLSAEKEMSNEALIEMLRSLAIDGKHIALERIEAMYAHVGKETVNTIMFCGQIREAIESREGKLTMLSPQGVKKIVCGTASAKDPAVRQALLDQLGPPGTKKNRGATYGVSSHAWRALAVAVAASQINNL